MALIPLVFKSFTVVKFSLELLVLVAVLFVSPVFVIVLTFVSALSTVSKGTFQLFPERCQGSIFLITSALPPYNHSSCQIEAILLPCLTLTGFKYVSIFLQVHQSSPPQTG